MNWTDLLREAEKLHLIVKEKELYATDGLCVGNKIAIDKNLTEREKYCTLAEEIGHYVTTTGNILDQSVINNTKQELIARRWGYQYILPLNKLIDAFENGCTNRYELAEYLGVTEKYLVDCINDYRNKYGIGTQFGKYYISFQPTLGIYKNFNCEEYNNE